MRTSTFSSKEVRMQGGSVILDDGSTMLFEVYPEYMSITWSTDISSAADALQRWMDAALIPPDCPELSFMVQIGGFYRTYSCSSVGELVSRTNTADWSEAIFSRLDMPDLSLAWSSESPQMAAPTYAAAICSLPFDADLIRPIVAATANPAVVEHMDDLLAEVAAGVA